MMLPQNRGQQKHSRVLVVDDDAPTASALKKLLQLHGLDARAAGSYKQALQLAGEWVPDLVVVDILLPDKDGLKLIQKLRSAYAELKAIAISGLVLHEVEADAHGAGCTEFLTKPINVERMYATIDRVLNGSPNRDAPQNEPSMQVTHPC